MTVWILVLHLVIMKTTVYTRPIGAFNTQRGCEEFIQHEAKLVDTTGAECLEQEVKEYP